MIRRGYQDINSDGNLILVARDQIRQNSVELHASVLNQVSADDLEGLSKSGDRILLQTRCL